MYESQSTKCRPVDNQFCCLGYFSRSLQAQNELPALFRPQAGPPPLRLWSDIQNAATKIRLCRPHHQLLIPASKPAQPQLWLCSKLALFAFGKGEQWVFFS